MNGTQEGFRAYEYIIFAAAAILTAVICVCLGSVNVPLKSTAEIFRRAILGLDMPKELPASIILTVRLPRVLCVALTGASLSLCGAAMQGLLKTRLPMALRSACPPAQASARLLPLRLAYRSLRSRSPARWLWQYCLRSYRF